MSEQKVNKALDNFSGMAKQAANEYARGNIIGATGIAGVSFVFAASVALIFGSAAPLIGDASEGLAMLLGGNGMILVFMTSQMYINRENRKHELTLALTNGYVLVTSNLIQKTNDGTVSANDIGKIAGVHMQSVLKMLTENKEEPTNGS